jgi:L-threonylcarbamoyladenylate synthase
MNIMHPTQDVIASSADVIRAGDVVVMPTETVYGLACDATNEDAVAKVYEIKARPANNPLIVHISELGMLDEVAGELSDFAVQLAKRFWPGPLTLVLPKSQRVPSLTTAGLDTVAVRMPNHSVAIELIRAAETPVAAPSANKFGEISPTTADEVDPKISEHAKVILDGGKCRVGIESTVLDLSREKPLVLRPGQVTRLQIESVYGGTIDQVEPNQAVRRSPGMYPRHYAPKTRMVLVDKLQPGQAGLTMEPPISENQVPMSQMPGAYAQGLYSALRRLDMLNLEAIYVQMPPDEAEWEAVRDRLFKASAGQDD